MEKFNKILIIAFAILSGCNTNSGPKMLIANGKVEVYKTHKGDSLQTIFILSPGEQCAVGKEVFEKMYGYIEVVCPGKGAGWVAKGDNYRIIDKNNVQNK